MLAMHFDDHPCYEICYGKTYSAKVMHKPSRDRGQEIRVHGAISDLHRNYMNTTGQWRGQRCENSFALAISQCQFGWPLFLIDGKKMPQPGRGKNFCPQNPIKTRA
jgi:hypothetical protein